MKRILLLPLLLICFGLSAQQQYGTLYVAAKNGLNMRESPEEGSNVLIKIPYGTKVTIIQSEEEVKKIITEGMTGYWQKVKYNNKTGYIVDSYLIPWAAPNPTLIKKTEYNQLSNYLKQVTLPFGAKLIIKTGNPGGMDDAASELNKQLYKNGAEWHHSTGWEWGTDTYILPGFSIQQGFLLLRLIPEFNEVLGDGEEFPTESKKYTKNEVEYDLTVSKRTYGEGEYAFTEIEKISISYSPDASYVFELFMLGGELVISLSGGV
jgi:uncharacterized protein YgiM (DUF1202 family)